MAKENVNPRLLEGKNIGLCANHFFGVKVIFLNLSNLEECIIAQTCMLMLRSRYYLGLPIITRTFMKIYNEFKCLAMKTIFVWGV